jgi:hypothetical protein
MGILALILLASGGAATVASASLAGQWRFDEPDGQVVTDDGPFALDGWLGAEPEGDSADPLRIGGETGGALRFDGTSYVRLPGSPALAPETLTAEAVMRAPTSPGSWRYLVSRGASGCLAGAYGLYTAEAGGVAIYVFDGSRYVVSATARPGDVWDGSWHHVIGTFDGGLLRLYVDGRPVGEPMPAPLRIDYTGTSTIAAIAQYGGTCDLAFAGDIDLVRLWSHALSAQDVVDESPPGAPTTPLPAAAPGKIIPAPLTPVAPATSATSATPATPATPVIARTAATPSLCTVRVAHKRVRAGRRVVVRARVTRLGRVHHPRVVARRAGRHRALSTARIGTRGNARLVLRLLGRATVEIRVMGRPSCAPAYVKVTR